MEKPCPSSLSRQFQLSQNCATVPITHVFPEDLASQCHAIKIFFCHEYLQYFETYFGHKFWLPASRKAQNSRNALFSFDRRKAVFHSCFPNLDFGCFNIYYAALQGRRRLDEVVPYVHSALVYCDHSPFHTATDMLETFDNLLLTLTERERAVICAKYTRGLANTEISAVYTTLISTHPHNVSPERVRQLEVSALRKLCHSSCFLTICPHI